MKKGLNKFLGDLVEPYVPSTGVIQLLGASHLYDPFIQCRTRSYSNHLVSSLQIITQEPVLEIWTGGR